MKNVGKKLCVFLLVAVMIVGLLPAAAFAESEAKVTYKLVFNGVQGKTGALKCTRPAGHELIPGDLFVTGLNVTGLWKDFENYFGGTEEDVESATLEKMHQYWEENPVNGYIFKGWFDAAEGGNEIGPGYAVKEGDRLYAHAEKEDHAVEAKPVETEELLEAAGSVQTFAMAMAVSTGDWFVTDPYTKENADNFFNQVAIADANSKVKSYAIIGNVTSTGDTSSSSVITIKSATHNAQEACVEIVGHLLESLYNEVKGSQAIAKVKPAAANPSTCLSSDGTMNLTSPQPSLSGEFAKDKATIQEFCQWLGIMQVTENKLSELDGKAFAFEIVGSNEESPAITYTFTFVLPKLDLTQEEEGKLVKDEENKTLTGTDLVDTQKTQGATAETVTGKFESFQSAGYVVKVVDKGENEIAPYKPVGTGSKVQLVKDGKVVDEITIIVKGDTDGDGLFSAQDATRVLNDVVGAAKLGDTFGKAYETAAHMDNQERLSAHDAQMILNLVLKAAEGE